MYSDEYVPVGIIQQVHIQIEIDNEMHSTLN